VHSISRRIFNLEWYNGHMSGDERPGVIAADIVFVVDEKNHVSFRRDGNDLIYSARLSLTEALCGTTLNIPHLDGTTIPLPVQDIISPNAMKVVRYVRLLLSWLHVWIWPLKNKWMNMPFPATPLRSWIPESWSLNWQHCFVILLQG